MLDDGDEDDADGESSGRKRPRKGRLGVGDVDLNPSVGLIRM